MILLCLKRAVPNLALAMQMHCLIEAVVPLTLEQLTIDSTPQFRDLNPIEREESALQAAKLPQTFSEGVEPGILSELVEDQRCGYSAELDGGNQAKVIIPIGSHHLGSQPTADER